MSQDSSSASGSSSPEPEKPVERKRKRETQQEDELEIDLSLPEPPSKRALRKLKKSGAPPSTTKRPAKTDSSDEDEDDVAENKKESAPAKSEWAIWIGNMLWSTTKDGLRAFFEKGGIAKDDITRVHMPAPEPKGPNWKGPKPVNKGFAYVDFRTQADMYQAVGLSETLLDGRKVLIKDAKNFAGRPEPKSGEAAVTPDKAPSKRVFVGNLAFDTTTDDLREHFSQAGTVKDVFLTTFEDSGKCKGYGWVQFAQLEAAEAAVKGFIMKAAEADDDSEDDADKEDSKKSKGKKPRKWFINQLQGRRLRTEFAEDSQTRYKKRFGKGKSAEDDSSEGTTAPVREKPAKNLNKDERQALRRQKHEDARLIAPGRALATAQRASAAIVSGAGTKTTFD